MRARAKRSLRLPRSAARATRPLVLLRGPMSLIDKLASGDHAAKPGTIEARRITIDGQLLEVAIRHGDGSGPPLLLFNGIGANWELAKPFLEALTSTTAIIFDVPGIGGSARRLLPYRPSTLARLAAGLVAELGYTEIDVAGVSWGGGIAQQFAHQYPKLCRRLVLAATAPGFTMVPASPAVLWKMATPRRYTDKGYMNRVAADIYGGAFRDDPSVPPVNGHILAGLIPNAELRMIDDGHLFIVTRPAETAALIEAFLADASKHVEPSSPLSRVAGWVRDLIPTFGGRRDNQASFCWEPPNAGRLHHSVHGGTDGNS